jgi:hypothetical protein
MFFGDVCAEEPQPPLLAFMRLGDTDLRQPFFGFGLSQEPGQGKGRAASSPALDSGSRQS